VHGGHVLLLTTQEREGFVGCGGFVEWILPGSLEIDRIGQRQGCVRAEHGRIGELRDFLFRLLRNPGVDGVGCVTCVSKVEGF